MVFGIDNAVLLSYLSQSYIKFTLIVILWFIGAYLIMFITKNYLLRLAKKTKTKADDLIIQKAGTPFAWLIFLMGTQASLGMLDLTEGTLQIIRNALQSIVLILVMYMILAIINVVVDIWGNKLVEKTKSTADDALLGMFHRVINILGIALAAVMIFDVWGIKVGPLVASLGIAGLAVAFALQSTLGNIFGGVSMIIDKTYRVGDWVDIDGVNGKVHDVGIRATKIRTWDNEIVTIPNGKAADAVVKNYTLPNKKIRVNVEFGVEYGSDIEKVQKIVIDTLKNHIKNMMEDPAPYALFKDLGDSSLNFVARFWIPDYGEKLSTSQLARTEIYKALNNAKIGIPFPQMDVHVKK